MNGVVTAAASAPVADLVTAACVLGMIVFGGQRGLFLALAAAFAVLTAFFAALAFGPEVAAVLESFDVPASVSLPAACLATAAVVAAAWRVAVDAAVRDDDVRFGGRVDAIGGAAVGAVAGVLLAGAVQVGWSMLDLPQRMRLDPAALRLDAGTRMLTAFARGVRIDAAGRDRVLEGGLGAASVAATGAPPRRRVSEPFDDVNANAAYDAGEPYLDEDGSGGFTPDRQVACRDGATAGQDEVGLRRRYRLAAWRRIRMLHAPRMTSPASATGEVAAGAVVYRIAAEDDDGDGLTYSLEPRGEEAGIVFAVDAASGEVRLAADEPLPEAGRVAFLARVTDATGLSDEKAVTVTLTKPAD